MARGLTLIETLVVLVLLGMIAGIAAAGLVGASNQAQLLETHSIVLDLDGRARSAALAGEAPVLMIDKGGLSLHTGSERDVLASRTLHGGVEVRFLDAEGLASIEALRYDARGHTRDYRMVLSLGDDHDRVRSWSVSGLTGWSESLP